jgi:hypothetical protein
MGASWRCLGAAALLLVLAAASAPPAWAGTAADPEVTDPAGDQDIDTGTVPVVPGFNDETFDDVDVVAAYVAEFAGLTRITVATTAAWDTAGTMTVAFSVDPGPTSLPGSTATGQAFTLYVNGTAVAGVANGTAATTAEGLRIDVPTANLGAVGGDLLANLTITTARTDTGLLQDVPEDDQTGSDVAGPGRAYTFERPPQAGLIRIAILGGTIGGSSFTGQSYAGAFQEPADVRLQLTNDGLDADEVDVTVGRAGSLPIGTNLTEPVTLQPGETRTVSAALTIPGGELPAGTTEITVSATSRLGGSDAAVLRIQVPAEAAPPPADREVKPAGLTFLTPGAEALGLDKAFGSYGEAFLLSLIVLLVILAIFLLMALGRSTTRGEPAPEAPWPRERGMPAALAGPAGLSETVRATPASAAGADADADNLVDDSGEGLADFGALAAAAAELAEPAPAPTPAAAPVPTTPQPTRIRIEEVRHTPREPEAGQRVVTEVILRNDGPAATLRLALGIDGKPVTERTVQVASRATKAVELPWTAGAGDNRVRIQAFPA